MSLSAKSFQFLSATPFTLCLLAAPLAAQAHLLLDLNPGIASSMISTAVAVLGERAIWCASDGTTSSLYSSDGTAGGTSAFFTLSSGSYAPELVTVGSHVFFAYGTSGTATATGSELWVTDGTTAGTMLVKDIRSGPFGSSPGGFADIDGIAYFSAADVGGNYELWRSDGTAVGTWLVKEIHTSLTTGSSPAGFSKLSSTGRFLFAATDATSGRELWVSDGTAAGTMLVKDIVPGPGGPSSSNPLYLTSFGDYVAFSCLGGLWISDGTDLGTHAVTSGASGARHLATQGGRVYFQAADAAGLYGNELWSSDGTSGGTTMVADIQPGGFGSTPYGSYPFQMTPVGSRWVFFSATTTASGEELWRSNGVITELVTEIASGSASGGPRANGYPGTHLLNSRFAVTALGKVFFFANDGVTNFEPWVFGTGIVAATTTFGSGCGGLSLTASAPWLGTTMTLTTSGIPALALLSANALSFTKYAPPIDLTSLGMPGCVQNCGLDSVLFLFGSPTATRTLTIPGGPSWLGAELQSQSWSLVPGINAMGAINSNGVTLRLGDL